MRVSVLGVPDSASAYCVGVERAPAALREAGLVDALSAAGAEVVDVGDLTVRAWAPDRDNRYAQNLGSVVETIRELADAASAGLDDDGLLLVLGGSCTVAVGVCAAVAGRGDRPRIVYIDRHLDLNTPRTTVEGSFSWMGMAHALGVEGAEGELVSAMQGGPVLHPADLVYLVADTAQATDGERSTVRELGITIVPQAELVERPREAARAAREALEPGAFMVHLDVDVLDFIDAPLAENVNGRNSGPTLAQLEQALVELVRRPDCRALSIGQLDPAHAASDPTAIPRLVGVLAAAVGARR